MFSIYYYFLSALLERVSDYLVSTSVHYTPFRQSAYRKIDMQIICCAWERKKEEEEDRTKQWMHACPESWWLAGICTQPAVVWRESMVCWWMAAPRPGDYMMLGLWRYGKLFSSFKGWVLWFSFILKPIIGLVVWVIMLSVYQTYAELHTICLAYMYVTFRISAKVHFIVNLVKMCMLAEKSHVKKRWQQRVSVHT